MSEAREPTAITLEGLAHHFGERSVFPPLNAQFVAGQTGVISGANGAGKSTLLRIVVGLLAPAHGKARVWVNGQEQDALARRAHIGYIAPELTLYRELTGAENLQFFADLQGRTLSRQELVEALTEVGLRGRGRDLVASYSSGMRQRLKYAFALLNRPSILILDEPTANLDTEGVAMTERIIRAHNERGGLTIIATNEPRELAWGEVKAHLEGKA